MRYEYVETSNHARFAAGYGAVEKNHSQKIMLLTGDPGVGKTTTLDHWGSLKNALVVTSYKGITLAAVRGFMADETSTRSPRANEQYKALVEAVKVQKCPIMFDEAQNGLEHGAAAIEFMRGVADHAAVPLILVCHTSEKHRFSAVRLAHLATRIGAVVEFKPPTPEDCGIYLRTLCDVAVDDGVIEQVYTQSRGLFRLIDNAGVTLEAVASRLGKSGLTAADVKGIRLCEDSMKSLARGAK